MQLEIIFVILIFILIGVFIILYESRRDKINPRITIKNNHLEIIGFLNNQIIEAAEIKKIFMVLSRDDEEDFPLDLVTFQFQLTNGKTFTLKENLNHQGINQTISDTITHKKVPTLPIFQIKELLKNNPKIEIDAFTKAYLQSGDCEDFLKSRQA